MSSPIMRRARRGRARNMAIAFKCTSCDKMIEAPDSLAGRRIKCPKCKQAVRVPDQKAPEEETLTVAPLDEEEERRRKRLISDALRLDQIIAEETPDAPEETPFHSPSVPVDEAALHEKIVQYLRYMADGRLEQASRLCPGIVSHGASAVAMIDAIALREIPEEALADVPPQVLSGLIRGLRAEFG